MTELEAALLKKVETIETEMKQREARLIELLKQQNEQQQQLLKQLSDLERRFNELVEEYGT